MTKYFHVHDIFTVDHEESTHSVQFFLRPEIYYYNLMFGRVLTRVHDVPYRGIDVNKRYVSTHFLLAVVEKIWPQDEHFFIFCRKFLATYWLNTRFAIFEFIYQLSRYGSLVNN